VFLSFPHCWPRALAQCTANLAAKVAARHRIAASSAQSTTQSELQKLKCIRVRHIVGAGRSAPEPARAPSRAHLAHNPARTAPSAAPEPRRRPLPAKRAPKSCCRTCPNCRVAVQASGHLCIATTSSWGHAHLTAMHQQSHRKGQANNRHRGRARVARSVAARAPRSARRPRRA
jgi:hypothetical protein